MRITAIVSFVAVVLIGSASVTAQQPSNGVPPKANPFGNLFGTPSKTASPTRVLFTTPALNQRPGLRLAPKPTVVCGLTLIPADPNVDPAIRHDVTKDGPKFLIRSRDPKICRR